MTLGSELRARDLVEAAATSGTSGTEGWYDPARRYEVHLPDHALPLYSAERSILRDQEPMRRQLSLSVEPYAAPEFVLSALRVNAPQWFLRDLDRCEPVGAYFQVPLEGTRLVGLWEEAAAEAAERRRPLSYAPRVASALELFNEERERHRALFRETWKAWLDDDAPRTMTDPFGGG